MAKVVKKKEQINATVSPWIKKQCLELAKTPEFSSISDVVSLALSEFFGKYDYIKTKELKEHETRIPDLLEVLMKTKEGQEWLKSVYEIEAKKINYSRGKKCLLEQNIEGFIGLRVKENFVPVFIDGDLEGVTGYDKEDFLSGKIKWVEIITPEDRLLACENLKKAMYTSDISTEIEYRILRKDGETRWVLQIFQKLPADSRSQGCVQSLIRDITKRKAADFTLKKTYEARIKEIHHRIKNNLQVISSLLSLEADRSTDARMLEAFRESQNRVTSMALIHEELYKGDEVNNLDFADYLRKLTNNLFHSYRLRNEEISLKLELEKIYLDINTAIPLGIIVNELISNALKYAFPSQKGGKIHVSLHTIEKCEKKHKSVKNSGTEQNCINKEKFQFVLMVSDNGDGFPEEIDHQNTDSLGLQIVNILVEQIEGYIELKRNNGTEFSIYFNKLV